MFVRENEFRELGRDLEMQGYVSHSKGTILSVMTSFKEYEQISFFSVENGLSERRRNRFNSPDERCRWLGLGGQV